MVEFKNGNYILTGNDAEDYIKQKFNPDTKRFTIEPKQLNTEPEKEPKEAPCEK